MNRILNFFAVIGLLGFCITLLWDNYQNGIAVRPEVIALLLIGTVFIIARRGILSNILKIVISLFGLGYTLTKINIISGSQFYVLFFYIGVLLIMLFGFYVMFGGLRKENDEIHFSINPKTGKIKKRWF